MSYRHIHVPDGDPIGFEDGRFVVGERPIVAFIEGDGTGPDIWRATRRVLEAAVGRAYDGRRAIAWMEVFAGEKANATYGETLWLPEETIDALRRFRVGIKGPLATPVGTGVRSINVALRLALDLYACVRPVRYFDGVPSPVKRPEDVDVVIFRENTEDVYTGIEFAAGSAGATRVLELLRDEYPDDHAKIRFPDSSAVGIKTISRDGTERLVRAAIRYAIDEDLPGVTLLHKGNIMKHTDGGFRDWGYALADREFGAILHDGGPWRSIVNPRTGREVIVNDLIVDVMLQQVLTRASEFHVVAATNQGGDYLSDALAAQVGGIGIAPGANLNGETGHALFEATHGSAPKYAGQDKVNPSSLILSGEMMLRQLGWSEAADLILDALRRTFAQKRVTYDFHRLMDGATLLRCSEFGSALVANMG